MRDIKTILITRPQFDAESLSHHLQKRGFDVLHLPLIEIHNLPVASDLDILKNDVYAFTSANGVRAAQAAKLPVRKAFAVGSATLKSCMLAGYEAICANGGVNSLAALIAAHSPPGRVLHLSGHDKAGDLSGSLINQGLEAVTVTLYRAEACTHIQANISAAIRQQKIDAVMLYSKRSAEIFCALMHQEAVLLEMQRVAYFCLSKNIADILVSHGFKQCFKQCFVAPKPTEESLFEILPNRD